MANNDSTPRPPAAEQRPVTRLVHDQELVDEYAWLRSPQWRTVMRDPSALESDIRAYLEAENAHAEQTLRSTEALQAQLFAEYKGRIKEDDSSVPEDEGSWSYYHRYEEGGQHPIFCRRPRGADGPESVLFNGEEASAGKSFFKVLGCEPSPDHDRVCVAVDESGAELWSLRFKDLRSGVWLPDVIEETAGSFEFVDNNTVIYTVLDEDHRPRTVKRHVLGEPSGMDESIYHEEDPGFFVGLGKTESERFIVVDAHDHQTSEVRLLDLESPEGGLKLVAKRHREIEYEVSHHGSYLLIRTNERGAEDFSMVAMPLSALGVDLERKSWGPWVDHEPGKLILDFHLFRCHMVLLQRVDGLPRLVVYELGETGLGEQHEISFSEDAYSLGLYGSREFDTSIVRFGYSSLTTPSQVFDYDMASRSRKLRKVQEVPSGHSSSDYCSQRLLVPSHDGELVPVSLLHHKDTLLDGTAPLFLYGYGAYGHAVPASFSVTRLSLVDRGFIYAIAHVRGGMERGFRWYREGKLAKKRNTFYDFAAAARALVDRGLVDATRVAGYGGSAGGMLMGVMANEHGDLFQAIIADVPFVDVLNTMLDASLPLTPPEWPEWGHPLEDKEAFQRIMGYSPYDNVGAKDYPNLLVMAGLTDPRVTYWEPAKWVARLRARKTDDNLLLFRTNMDSGHAGSPGRLEALKEVALQHAFLLKVFGLDSGSQPSH